jgi:hypothetical protein
MRNAPAAGNQEKLRTRVFVRGSKAVPAARFTKCVCKILSPKGLEVGILKTQPLAPPFRVHPRRRRRPSCLGSQARGKVRGYTMGRRAVDFYSFASRHRFTTEAQRPGETYPFLILLPWLRASLVKTGCGTLALCTSSSLATSNLACFLTGLTRWTAELFLGSCPK